jgi:hypothetical protein
VAFPLDLPRHRLPERIGASGAEVRAAIAALERVAPLLEREGRTPGNVTGVKVALIAVSVLAGLSVQVPNDARIERLEADVVGEAIGWDLDQAL